ncbi:unnamed protein product [Nezara viridula]|uniref:E2F/DP family winged-helix DNA-binding domain-containing protein n=1 Tax=Nezara viridula TaxID=85310 RepID=A0A9P0HJY6_NEZVI|nr:unnamed protein product [Nezara viridula]
MSKVQRSIKLEDEEYDNFHSTPDMNSAKFSSPCKIEMIDNAVVTSPFHLLDHGYGRTPQSQPQRQMSNARTQAVKRKLNMETSGDEEMGFKTPKSRKKNNSLVRTPRGPTRYDTSLGLLTKKFVNLLQRSPRGIVDLNYASQHLDVQKRRIYDITNVLEGVGILEKRSKNNIQWRGGSFTEPHTDVQNEIEKLEQEEKDLDDLKKAEMDLQTLLKDNQYAYVSYQDLRSIKNYSTQTVMVIKAPPDTHLEVPTPTSNSRVEMVLKTERGEIEVFLCPDIKNSKEERSDSDSISTPSTSRDFNPTLANSPEKCKVKMEKDASNALLSTADEFQPYPFQTTEDQHSSGNDWCEDVSSHCNQASRSLMSVLISPINFSLDSPGYEAFVRQAGSILRSLT